MRGTMLGRAHAFQRRTPFPIGAIVIKWSFLGLTSLLLGFLAYRYAGFTSPGVNLYRTAAVSRGDIIVVVTATGTINPVTSVQVGCQLSGMISKLYVDFNSKVTKGMLLGEIDPST